jgi:hypothetical protein
MWPFSTTTTPSSMMPVATEGHTLAALRTSSMVVAGYGPVNLNFGIYDWLFSLF